MARIIGTVGKNNYVFFADLTESSISNSNNTSKVTYNVYLQNNNVRTNSGGWTFNAKIDGTNDYNETSQTLNTTDVSATGGNHLVFSGSKTITHNSNGSKTISFSAKLSKSSYTAYDPGECNLSGNFTLTTIPRQSTPSASDGNIGSTITIRTNRASSSFTHTLKYKAAGQSSYTTIATDVGSSTTWTIPTSLYALIPNNNSIDITISCDTYSGSTKIGNTTTITIKGNVANSNPTITSSSITRDSTTVNYLSSSGLIQNFSDITLTVGASALNSATLSSIFMYQEVNGEKTILQSNSVSGATATTTFSLQNVTIGTFKFGAIDSRGNTTYDTSYAITQTLYPYIIPQINSSSTIKRLNQTSSTLNVNLSGSYAQKVGTTTNSLTIQYRYRESGGTWSSYTSISPTSTTTTDNVVTYNVTNTQIQGFNYQTQYEVEILVSDLLNSTTNSFTITKGIDNFGIYPKGLTINGGILAYGENGEIHLSESAYIEETGTTLGDLVQAKSDLNELQTKLTKVELFSGSSTTGTITLSDSVDNYERLEIIDNRGIVSIIEHKVRNTFILSSTHISSSTNVMYLEHTSYSASGTTITPTGYRHLSITSGSSPTVTETNSIYIIKVYGYKY